MKKYIPAKMIRKSRFITFYDTWNKDEKEKLLERMSKLIFANGGSMCDYFYKKR